MKGRTRNPVAVIQNKSESSRRAGPAWLALILFAFCAIALPASGQQLTARTVVAPDDTAEVYQALLDLQNPWTVMCVAAHPDDEDGATLTILRRKYGAHTVTLFSTYGEGGQNAVGPELYEELGAIRARETIAASRIQGSEPHFLGLKDFGFSKSAEEAFRVWGHDEALRRMVLKIRELRPDVIITHHDTSSGHGHHQATGRLVLEAFDAAADPRRFPEQLRAGLRPWQVQRLFVRFQFEGSASKAAEEEALRTGRIVSVNPNERDPVRTSTYAEQALSALQQHATQGPWPQTLPAGGRPVIRYRLARTARNAQALPAEAQSVLDGLSLPQSLAEQLTPLATKAIFQLYSAPAHQSFISALASARRSHLFDAPATVDDRPRFQLMRERLDRALVTTSGISATLNAHDPVLIPGDSTSFTLKITNGGDSPALLKSLDLRGLRLSSGVGFPRALAPGEVLNVELRHRTPRRARITVPSAEHLYDGNLFGKELSASLKVEIDGASFPVNATARLDVAPAIEIANVSPSPFVLTPGGQASSTMMIKGSPADRFNVRLVNHRNRSFDGQVIISGLSSRLFELRAEVRLEPGEAREVSVNRVGDFALLSSEGAGRARAGTDTLTFSVIENGRSAPLSRRKVRVVRSDARVATGVRVGYVRSFDETLKNSLDLLGVEATELTVEDVRASDLNQYQTIIIDNRGYQAHPELVRLNSRLLDYVRTGGTLIVFYHRTNEWNPDPNRNRPQLAPYPITLGNARVTDETARIEFVEPAHPLLNYPNKITQADFAGWIQERGLYYPQVWDKQYSAPLSTRDAGEQPLRGGLLAAEYGRGRYIYTSMVWYRQLRAGVPGAYRVLANMISYGR